MDILPAIDLRDGKCVRLLQGDYDRQIDYGDDPVAVASEFAEVGARWVHVVDLDGAREGRLCNLPVIKRIIEQTQLRVEVGGGLRTVEAIQSLLDVGAARCVVGTKALEDWAWFEGLMSLEQAANKVALGLDAREGKLAVKGWTEETTLTAVELADRAAAMPVGAIIYTDIGRDGMLLGPNIEATQALAEHSRIPVIASGGVTDLNDVRQLAKLSIAGMIIGRALYENELDLKDALEAVADGAPS